MRREYKEKEAQQDSELVVEFESDRIAIDIPLEGIVVGGWKITPLAAPVVANAKTISIVPYMISVLY